MTRWTVVRRMADDREVVRLEGWQEFTEVYWTVPVEWLERQGVSLPNAQDLVQGFIEKLWKSEHFASTLSPEGGKLRSFRLKSLRNWHLDQLANKNRLKRGGGIEHLEYDVADGGTVVPDRHNDHAWARATLTHACQGLRAEYKERENSPLFDQGLTLLADRDLPNSSLFAVSSK